MKLHSHRTSPFSLQVWTASVALLITSLWPAAAIAGRAEGTTDSLRNKSAVDSQPESSAHEIFIPNKGIPPELSPAAVQMTPWCTFDANLLQSSCEEGLFSCGDFEIPCGMDSGGLEVVAAGTGMRNSALVTIPLRGARSGIVPVFGLLMWSVIDRQEPGVEPRGGEIVFGDNTFFGIQLAESEEPCWSPEPPDIDDIEFEPTVLRTYIADVTNYLYPLVNGDYPVLLDGSSLTNGESPWGPPPPQDQGFLAEGVSLIVVTAHPEVALDSLVALHGAPTFMLGDLEFHHDLGLPAPAGTRVRSIRIGADGGTRSQGEPILGYRTLFGVGDEDEWVVLRGEGSEIDSHRDWQGHDGGTSRGWDTQTTDTDTVHLGLIPGTMSYQVGYELEDGDGPYDCVSVLSHIIWLEGAGLPVD